MLEIVQAGQAGKTKLLFDMHRMRKRVFADRMKWDVTITQGGLEVDQFDLPDTVYLLSVNAQGNVIGNWRLLPTNGPTMIRDVWPDFLKTLPMPSVENIWEASRFAVEAAEGSNAADGLAQVNYATQELFCGMAELCMMCGIKEIFTLYDMRIARLLRRLDCRSRATSEKLKIDGRDVEIGAFTMDEVMLGRLRAASGIDRDLVSESMLPPVLVDYKKRLGGVKSGLLFQHAIVETIAEKRALIA